MQVDLAGRDARLAVLRANPERLRGLMVGMAQFLAGMLSLRDAGVKRAEKVHGERTHVCEPTLCSKTLARRPSLAKLFLDVGGYMPTIQTLKDEAETRQIHREINMVRRMEFDIARNSTDNVFVMLAEFVNRRSFQLCFWMPRRDGQEVMIGGTRHRLVPHVEEEAREWFELVASRLVRAGVAPATEEELEAAIDMCAGKTARRMTLAEDPAHEDSMALTKVALHDFAEFDGEVPDDRLVDCIALAMNVAVWGSRMVFKPADAAAVRRCIQKVVATLTPSFGFVGMNAARANLDQLRRAVLHEDATSLWRAVDAWSQESGPYAHLALLDILFLLTHGGTIDERLHVLSLWRDVEEAAGDDAHAAAVGLAPWMLPPPEFCAPLDRYVFDRERIGDKNVANVLKYMTAQLLYTPAVFERGVVTKRAASDAFYEGCKDSAAVVGYLSEATEHLRIGLPLRDFMRQVLDRASPNYPQIVKNMVGLSAFSIQDMYDVFHHESPMYAEVRAELQTLTNGYMTVPLPRNNGNEVYRGFANDGLLYGLPLLFEERRACGLAVVKASNPLLDMINSLDATRCVVWRDALCVSKQVVKRAHPMLLSFLDQLVAGGVVPLSRPWYKAGGEWKRFGAPVYQVPLALIARLR